MTMMSWFMWVLKSTEICLLIFQSLKSPELGVACWQSHELLECIIENNILLGTRIWTNEQVTTTSVTLDTSITSMKPHFVDPATRVHTNNTDAQWSVCKVRWR